MAFAFDPTLYAIEGMAQSFSLLGATSPWGGRVHNGRPKVVPTNPPHVIKIPLSKIQRPGKTKGDKFSDMSSVHVSHRGGGGKKRKHPTSSTKLPHGRQLSHLETTDPDSETAYLQVGTRYYPILSALGSGGFSQVFLVKRSKGASAAVKKVVNSHKTSGDYSKRGIPCLMEATIMSTYSHPNLVTSSRIEGVGHTLYIFQEVAKCDLDQWRQRTYPTYTQVRVLFHSVLRALEYLHGEGIIHADVKDQNILVYGDHDFRLGDGSLACFEAWPRSHLPNTASFRPPEGWPWLAERDPAYGGPTHVWGPKVDVFSLGCTMYRVIFDHALFYGQSRSGESADRHKRHINALLEWIEYYYSMWDEPLPENNKAAEQPTLGQGNVPNDGDGDDASSSSSSSSRSTSEVPAPSGPPGVSYYPLSYEEPNIDPRLRSARRDCLVSIMLAALHPSVVCRPTVSALLAHPIFDSLNETSLDGHRRMPRSDRTLGGRYIHSDGAADSDDEDNWRGDSVSSFPSIDPHPYPHHVKGRGDQKSMAPIDEGEGKTPSPYEKGQTPSGDIEEALEALSRGIRTKYDTAVRGGWCVKGMSSDYRHDENLLDLTTRWIARKVLRCKGPPVKGITPKQWTEMYKIEEDVLRAIDYMIHA